ncbi:GNAT family N-acetyltransferase [[Actinomadura] parvosata subsp. kistnae]|uniref:GNAT family N-acetyltransferase n=1 Tax=[Actinomadura] parvosata subsp. kistnae TaxID=1909395 RepID=A0A1U9ZUK1_9ACTN|nr:GNAT family N-acetyltransferase [Nonomuraea sp. ATCC 55076]AQZ61624.1 GNAT family N-acetyltransferase [Nonomuraea sp. ATCC 55076]
MTSIPVTVRPMTAADHPVAERLWLMFRHDMADFQGGLPSPDGTYHSDRLRAALKGDDWIAYLFTSGDSPVGFAFVRALSGPERVLNSFFIVRGARRSGIGLTVVREVIARHPGRWRIAFQDANTAGVAFWRRVATELAGDAWTEERLPVPHRPDAPPDVWISFTSAASAPPR